MNSGVLLGAKAFTVSISINALIYSLFRSFRIGTDSTMASQAPRYMLEVDGGADDPKDTVCREAPLGRPERGHSLGEAHVGGAGEGTTLMLQMIPNMLSATGLPLANIERGPPGVAVGIPRRGGSPRLARLVMLLKEICQKDM